MSKFAAPKLAKDKKRERTSFRLPDALLNKIHSSMKAQNYTIKQRSKWLNEAVLDLQEKEFVLLVLEDFLYPGKNDKIALTLSEQSAQAIEHVTHTIKTEENETPPVGAILRTAALQRIMSESVPTRDKTL